MRKPHERLVRRRQPDNARPYLLRTPPPLICIAYPSGATSNGLVKIPTWSNTEPVGVNGSNQSGYRKSETLTGLPVAEADVVGVGFNRVAQLHRIERAAGRLRPLIRGGIADEFAHLVRHGGGHRERGAEPPAAVIEYRVEEDAGTGCPRRSRNASRTLSGLFDVVVEQRVLEPDCIGVVDDLPHDLPPRRGEMAQLHSDCLTHRLDRRLDGARVCASTD